MAFQTLDYLVSSCFMVWNLAFKKTTSLLVPLLVVCFKLKCHALSCLTCRSSGAAVLGLRVAEKLWKAKFAKQIEVISLCWCKSGNFAIANRAHLGHSHATSDVLAICRPPETDSTGAGTSKVFKWRRRKDGDLDHFGFGILWVGIYRDFMDFPGFFRRPYPSIFNLQYNFTVAFLMASKLCEAWRSNGFFSVTRTGQDRMVAPCCTFRILRDPRFANPKRCVRTTMDWATLAVHKVFRLLAVHLIQPILSNHI